MAINLDLLHHALRYSHIVIGFLGLVLFWIPVFATKGGRLHVRAGRVFACCAAYAGLTGLLSSIWALVAVDSFLGPTFATVSDRARPYAIEQTRFLFALLGYLSLAVLSGLWFGLRAVWTRRRHEALREPVLLTLHLATAAAGLALFAFGLWTLLLGYRGEHLLPAAALGKYWIFIVLGLLGVLSVKSELQYVYRPRPSRMAWVYKHIENMLGVGIAFHTAFLVFGANRLFGAYLPGAWALLPWVLPSAIGIPATALWVRSYRRKFDELEPRTPVSPSLVREAVQTANEL